MPALAVRFDRFCTLLVREQMIATRTAPSVSSHPYTYLSHSRLCPPSGSLASLRPSRRFLPSRVYPPSVDRFTLGKTRRARARARKVKESQGTRMQADDAMRYEHTIGRSVRADKRSCGDAAVPLPAGATINGFSSRKGLATRFLSRYRLSIIASLRSRIILSRASEPRSAEPIVVPRRRRPVRFHDPFLPPPPSPARVRISSAPLISANFFRRHNLRAG